MYSKTESEIVLEMKKLIIQDAKQKLKRFSWKDKNMKKALTDSANLILWQFKQFFFQVKNLPNPVLCLLL